jgi:hypothetical protein
MTALTWHRDPETWVHQGRSHTAIHYMTSDGRARVETGHDEAARKATPSRPYSVLIRVDAWCGPARTVPGQKKGAHRYYILPDTYPTIAAAKAAAAAHLGGA